MSEFAGKHVLIIIENLPAPFDRRVWQEATTLKKNGAEVSIICPKMKGYTKSFEVINEIAIYRHPLPIEGSSAIGYLLEYSISIFWEIILSIRVYLKRRFHVIHGCNPPDLIFLTSLLFKPFGVKYVFDHHDINPELYVSKYGKKGFFHKALLFIERVTFKVADFSIATNESYKEIAINRGKMDPSKVQVVRSGPSLERLKILPPKDKYKKGRTYLIGYVGVIGEQEGLDLLLDIAKVIVSQRDDVQFAIIGDGTYLNEIKRQCKSKNLTDFVDFYGRVSDQELLEILNTTDVCVNPDKPTEMNNLSTMNKIMEYMALGKPIVQFDLKEGKFSAQKASLYAENEDINDFAQKICQLLQSEKLREELGAFGRSRIKNELSWEHESHKIVKFYQKIFDRSPTSEPIN